MVHVLVINLEHNHDEMWLATLTNAHCVLQMVNCSVNHINKIDGEDLVLILIPKINSPQDNKR